MKALLLSIALWLTLAMPVLAVTPSEILPDAKLEARARALSAQLRCMVCQNQSIDDSDADLARDLRKIVRERVAAGEPDDTIMAYLTARYGDFILLQPPFNTGTMLLWGAPVLALLLGGAVMGLARRKRLDNKADAVPLDEVEQARLAALVNGR